MNLGCILLASGFGRRFGGNKLLVEVEGAPLFRRAFSALPPALFQRAVVTSQYATILSAATAAGYLAQSNPSAEEGIAAGIRLGLAQMADMDGVLFAVCDQPWLATESVRRLIAAWCAAPRSIAALAWQGARGNPVIFPRDLLGELAALTGDKGGGAVIARHRARLLLVEVAGPRELEDVDTAPPN